MRPAEVPLPDPAEAVATSDALLRYLDYFRAEARRKVTDLDAAVLHTSVLPSGWTPAGLLTHLAHMERRWLVWGFLGEPLDDPWADRDVQGRWSTTATPEELLAALDAGGRRTRAIVDGADLSASAASTGRFADDPVVPTLLGILLHVLQEYARHLGHLDVVRELVDGEVGEG